MVCEARETDKLDCMLRHLRNMTVTYYYGHLAVHISCSEEDLAVNVRVPIEALNGKVLERCEVNTHQGT